MRKPVKEELAAYREHLEELVAERPWELSRVTYLMSRREVPAAKLKDVIHQLHQTWSRMAAAVVGSRHAQPACPHQRWSS